jgi:hypothetical protein
MTTRRTLAAAVALGLAVALAGCSGDDSAPDAQRGSEQGSAGNVVAELPPTTSTTRPEVAGNVPGAQRVADPSKVAAAYEQFAREVPDDELIDPDDAFIRAWLAPVITCDWPAGSTDALLIDAYRPVFEQFPDWGC